MYYSYIREEKQQLFFFIRYRLAAMFIYNHLEPVVRIQVFENRDTLKVRVELPKCKHVVLYPTRRAESDPESSADARKLI